MVFCCVEVQVLKSGNVDISSYNTVLDNVGNCNLLLSDLMQSEQHFELPTCLVYHWCWVRTAQHAMQMESGAVLLMFA